MTDYKSTYSEKLKHPSWQKKRLEILQRDDWTCQCCGAKDKELHVHHAYYERGKDPWDYPDSSLSAICHLCHELEHECAKGSESYLIEKLHELGAYSNEVSLIGSAFDSENNKYQKLRGREWLELYELIGGALAYRLHGGSLHELVDLIGIQISKITKNQ